jgi:type II secretory pathway pseudopilin PulG
MQNSRATILQRVLMLLTVVLIVKVTFSVMLGYRNYLPPNFESDFLRGRQAYFYASYRWAFYTHIVSGPASIVLGLVLVSDRFRLWFPTWHRSLGKAQAAIVLFLLAPSGLWMAPHARTGTIAAIGFSLLAIATGICVLFGWRSAVKRRFAEHRRWMLRCFLLLCSAVVLRIIGGLVTVTGVGITWGYPLASWASWLSPLAAFEFVELLRRRYRPASLRSNAILRLHPQSSRCLRWNSALVDTLSSPFSSFIRGYAMDKNSDLRHAFTPVALRCGNSRLEKRRHRLAFTLVELLVVVGIVVLLLMLLIPSVREAREPARRNGCLNNLKQLSLAIQNHHDTRGFLPLASTSPLVTADGIQKYGAVGNASPRADSPTNWTAGQQGDGYSWIAQCLPFLEESTLYEKMTAAQVAPVLRYGKLADAAFAPSSNLNLEATGSNKSPFFWSTTIPALVCPSFPGDDDVPVFGSIPGLKVATGNYVALAATHYRSSPTNHLESGVPSAAGSNADGKDCTTGRYCGNGGIPFPGIVGGKVQRTGLRLLAFSNGASKVAIITESREENLTSWYSGLASYVVATMPPPNGGDPAGVESAPGRFIWTCNGVTNCDTALNKGDVKRETSSNQYQPISPHGGGARIWGPSSRHPGVVLHGYADCHVDAINDDIDKNAYLQLVLRSDQAAASPE